MGCTKDGSELAKSWQTQIHEHALLRPVLLLDKDAWSSSNSHALPQVGAVCQRSIRDSTEMHSLPPQRSFSPCLNTYMPGLVGLGWVEMGWTRRRKGLGLGLGLVQRPGLGLGQWASGMVKGSTGPCAFQNARNTLAVGFG